MDRESRRAVWFIVAAAASGIAGGFLIVFSLAAPDICENDGCDGIEVLLPVGLATVTAWMAGLVCAFKRRHEPAIILFTGAVFGLSAWALAAS